MIIKNLTRRCNGSTGTRRLLSYVLGYTMSKDKQLLPNGKHSNFIVRHNIRGRDINSYVQEYLKNTANRLYKRKDEVLHHTIISFAASDSSRITDIMLKDIIRKFIELRGENNLYICSKHLDRSHLHIHAVVSSNQINGLSSSMRKNDFAKMKDELQKYQEENYPELFKSVVQHGRSVNKRAQEISASVAVRDRQFQKAALIEMLDWASLTTNSIQEFKAIIEKKGYTIYERNGRVAGMMCYGQGQRKFRLSTLGYTVENGKLIKDCNSRNNQALAELRTIRHKSHKMEMENVNESEVSATFESELELNKESKAILIT